MTNNSLPLSPKGKSMSAILIDRFGEEISDVSELSVRQLLSTLNEVGDDDSDFFSVAVVNDEEWSLTFTPNDAFLEQVEPGGRIVGRIFLDSLTEKAVMARELIDKKYDPLFSREWKADQ